ncbi:hypothetical protein HAP41_0000000700 [Bradyrhizobium barranii subsp. apii]|nr:hypothetical protein [Bradyrhizobium barranii]UPT87727.1 hypothetical protein HAP41_0000000700 [Bradyrhizobium barranii subsp. apii]
MNMKVELPAIAASGLALAGMAAAVNPVLAGIAGVTLLVAKVLRDRRKGRQALLSTSPVSYLFRVEEALSPGTLAKWISKDALEQRVAH